MCGIALDTAQSGTSLSNGVLLKGIVNLPYSVIALGSANSYIGRPLYIKEDTGGTATINNGVPSSTGDYIRIMGYVLGYQASPLMNRIYFNPSSTWLVRT